MAKTTAFAGCRYCGGRGCIACAGEMERAEPRVFEADYIIRTNHFDEDVKRVAGVIGREAIERLAAQGFTAEQINREMSIGLLTAQIAQRLSAMTTGDSEKVSEMYRESRVTLSDEYPI